MAYKNRKKKTTWQSVVGFILLLILWFINEIILGNVSTTTSVTSETTPDVKVISATVEPTPNVTMTPTEVEQGNSGYSSDTLEVYFFDVGQADSILLLTGGKSMLVDTGNAGDAALDDKVKDKINLTHELRRLGLEKIDILVATHPHEDHMGSMYKILQMFEVDNVYANAFPPVDEQKNYFKRFVSALEKSDTHLISPTTLSVEEIKAKIDEYNEQLENEIVALAKEIEVAIEKGIDVTKESEALEILKQEEKLTFSKDDYIWLGNTIQFGEATVTMIAPKSAEYSDINDYSIVLMVEFDGVKLLLTGDAGKESEEEMLQFAAENNFELDCDILKVGHHGSRTASTEEFISAVAPEYAIIMVEEDNSYGLPDEDVIERLENHNAIIYQMMDVGDIRLVIDDGEYEFDFSYKHEVKEE